MPKMLDLTQQRFGRLIALKPSGTQKNQGILWLCQCDCGTRKAVAAGLLRYGSVQSCGCLGRERLQERISNLTGQRFGKLVVLCPAGIRQHQTYWLCQCDCGKQNTISAHALKKGTTRTCGCSRQTQGQVRCLNLVGRRFGRLVVMEPYDHDRFGKLLWLCRCDCGMQKTVKGFALKSGHTKSCGCILRNRQHGKKNSSEYRVWQSMKTRCLNPNRQSFPYYGGRGITICQRWLASFEAFLEDMGSRPGAQYSLERKDTNGPYSKENCIWATTVEQMNNTSRNRHLTFQSETRTMAQWAAHQKMSYTALRHRIRLGWPIEKALLTPVRVIHR